MSVHSAIITYCEKTKSGSIDFGVTSLGGVWGRTSSDAKSEAICLPTRPNGVG